MLLDTDEKRVLVPLEDEDGNVEIYERSDLVEYLQYTFGIFLPECQSEGEVVILQLTGDDEEKAECYDAPENETLEQAAFDLFCAKNMSRFAFDGADGNDLL